MKRLLLILSLIALLCLGFACKTNPPSTEQTGFVVEGAVVGSQTITVHISERTQIVSSLIIDVPGIDPGSTFSITPVIATNAITDKTCTLTCSVGPPALGKAADITLLTTSVVAKAMSQTTVTIQFQTSSTSAAAAYVVTVNMAT
jgi:hypothetical protein